MEPETLEGRVRQLSFNERRKELNFTVRTKDGDEEVFSTFGWFDKLKDEYQAYVGETVRCVGKREGNRFVAESWKLHFGPVIAKNLAMTLVTERGMITPKQFFETLVNLDGSSIGTVETAAQSTAEPTMFGGRDGKPNYAYVIGWILARTKNLRGDPVQLYRVLVEAVKVETTAGARVARRQMHSKADEYIEALTTRFAYKFRVVRSGRLEDPKFPDALPEGIK